jgi:hypothetical protein
MSASFECHNLQKLGNNFLQLDRPQTGILFRNYWEIDQSRRNSPEKDGGAEGARTPDPHNAIVVLYQLSYDPIR